MPRVLITGHTFRRTADGHDERLKAAGCELIVSPILRPATEGELIPLVADVDAVLASTDAFTRPVLEAASRLKIIARFGVGFDAIDVPAASDLGIWVTTTPGTNELSVADMALTMILNLARVFVPAVKSTRDGLWERPIGLELHEQRLGLIGFGRIGRQVAQRARAFGMDVVIFDVFKDEKAAAELGCRYVPLDELLRTSDFISLHAPATAETRDIINKQTLSQMKPTAYLVNTARGELVNESDLADALKSERIAGAALDVFKSEPPEAGNPLIGLPNLLPLPHIAGLTEQSCRRMSKLSVDNILAALAGERPPHPVNDPPNPRR
jgi:D-3-phosphoglycerate dehydrogenase